MTSPGLHAIRSRADVDRLRAELAGCAARRGHRRRLYRARGGGVADQAWQACDRARSARPPACAGRGRANLAISSPPSIARQGSISASMRRSLASRARRPRRARYARRRNVDCRRIWSSSASASCRTSRRSPRPAPTAQRCRGRRVLPDHRCPISTRSATARCIAIRFGPDRPVRVESVQNAVDQATVAARHIVGAARALCSHPVVLVEPV